MSEFNKWFEENCKGFHGDSKAFLLSENAWRAALEWVKKLIKEDKALNFFLPNTSNDIKKELENLNESDS